MHSICFLRKRDLYEINPENKGTVFILNLDTPFIGSFYDESMGYEGNEITVNSVQVSMDRSEYEKYSGQTITMTGVVMIGHTGHHTRDIVLSADFIG